MERSLLIGIAIAIAIIAVLYVINASLGFYPDGNELLEMLVTAFLGVALIGITFFMYTGVTKEKGPNKSIIDTFENSNKDALNAIIEIKDDFISSKEIINLEAEGLAIGEFDEGYVLNLGDGKYLYATLSGISNVLQDEIRTAANANDSVKALKEDFVNSIIDSAQKGSLSIKETLNEQMNAVFKDGSNADTTQESVLSFSYRDYLRLFSMLVLYNGSGENASLKRVADLIQINLTKKDNKLDLSKAYSNISIEYSYKSKPTLLSLSLFDDYDSLIDDMFNKNSMKISKGY